MKLQRELRELDWHVLLLALVLVGLGTLFIRSATQEGAEFAFQTNRHLASLPIILGVMVAALAVPYLRLRRWAPWIFGLCLLLLLLLPFLGVSINNARRWLRLGFVTVQPSEFMKLGLILLLARYYHSRQEGGLKQGLLLPGILTMIPMLLIIKEPDLSSALVLLPILFGLAYMAGLRLWWLLAVILLGLVAFLGLYHLGMLKEYQLDRINAWLAQGGMGLPENRELRMGAGYHLWQSLIAIGGGGWSGQGYMQGYQNTYDFLPYRSTDFIFSVIAEESGFLGSLALLFLYGLLVSSIFGIASRTREPFGRFLVTGIAILFGAQLVMHVAVCTGLIPPTGLSLPLISYGRSSLLTSFAALGLALNVGMRRVHVMDPEEY